MGGERKPSRFRPTTLQPTTLTSPSFMALPFGEVFPVVAITILSLLLQGLFRSSQVLLRRRIFKHQRCSNSKADVGMAVNEEGTWD